MALSTNTKKIWLCVVVVASILTFITFTFTLQDRISVFEGKAETSSLERGDRNVWISNETTKSPVHHTKVPLIKDNNIARDRVQQNHQVTRATTQKCITSRAAEQNVSSLMRRIDRVNDEWATQLSDCVYVNATEATETQSWRGGPMHLSMEEALQYRLQHTVAVADLRNMSNVSEASRLLLGMWHTCDINTNHTLPQECDIDEMWINADFCYLHVYKSGGTTIFRTLDLLAKQGLIDATEFCVRVNRTHCTLRTISNSTHLYQYDRALWSMQANIYESCDIEKSRSHQEYLQHHAFFTFVRDPVDHYVSAYFQAMVDTVKRNIEIHGKPGMDLNISSFRLRHFETQLSRQYDVYTAQYVNHIAPTDSTFDTVYAPDHPRRWLTRHMLPQTHFLTNKHWQKHNVSHLGYLNAFLTTQLWQILQPYLSIARNESYVKANVWAKIKSMQTRKRSATHLDYAGKFKIAKADLTQSNIRKICDLFWMDYMCLPFEMPKECNLRTLFQRHYGVNVLYFR